ncbi:MAG: MATE family efflux transporter [Candidatus Marinimicrobia bacterium]|nr:MATE family efflux transporter [Candidatus Neomarinimicrobiota bacterium]
MSEETIEITPKEKSSRLKEFISNPRKGLWTLAIPTMLGMVVQTVYIIVDMIFVGRVSGEALTALAFNMPLIFFATGISFGLGIGVTATIAKFIGAERKQSADNSAEHAVMLGVIIGSFFTFIGLLWGKRFLSTLGVPPNLLELAWSYFRIMATGHIFVVMSIFFRSILSGEGDMKTPMLIQGGSTLLNIILDPILIFGLGMGVRGAALATVVSAGVSASAFAYFLLVKGHAYIAFTLKDFKISREIVEKIFKIGIPSSFSMVIMSLGSGAFNKILISFSGDPVAAYQVGHRVDHFFLMPAIAIASSAVTLVGMFYGAKRRDLLQQIIKYGMSRAVYIGLGMGAIIFTFAPQIMALFSDDVGITTAGIHYLRIMVFSYPFIAISMMSGRILQGLGHGMPMLVITFLRVLLVSISLAYVFVYWMNKPVEWVWIAMVISMLVSAAVAYTWLFVGLKRVMIK